jgi:hypothetical protein
VTPPVLHIPIDFERRENVRRFRRAQGNNDLAIVMLFRMWVDWATAGSEIRKIRDLPAEGEIKWDEQEITYIVEEFCGWGGKAGALIRSALDCGVLSVVKREFEPGKSAEYLVLNDFWQFNQHFASSYKTIQQKGALARNVKRSAENIAESASRRVDIMADRGAQFALDLDSKPTTEEVKRCVTLIMLIDRACNRGLRDQREFTKNESLMNSALQVVRKYSQDDVNAVYKYIIEHRDNPRLGKIPERIIERFSEHLGKAKSDASS